MRETIEVDVNVTVEDRDGTDLNIDTIRGTDSDIEITLDTALPTEDEYELLKILSDQDITTPDELRELCDSPALTQESVREFITEQSAQFKLDLLKELIKE